MTSRRALNDPSQAQAVRRLRLRKRRVCLQIEPLEDRLMLSASPSSLSPNIVVGRTLSTYFAGAVQNKQLSITYTVYNEQADPETAVLLTTTLQNGVTFASASQQPDQKGQNLAWSLGTIEGYGRASVTLTVTLASPTPLQLDGGAVAFATLDAGSVSGSTPAATLQAGNLADPGLLASTPDANTTDPFVQNLAAALDYDPQQIFDYLHTQIGYNAYLGSVRGARGTIWSDAGNALDVASLGVALMRASGIPAQYVQGTLSPSQAQSLILTMFPTGYQTAGYLAPGVPTADPVNDPQLLSETESHYWFQFQTSNGLEDADPLMPGATVGQTFTSSSGTFDEVADSLREKTEVQLNAEFYSPGLFGLGAGLSRTKVLDQTFNDVDLVGHPLTFGNIVDQSSIPSIITSTTNTYTPYVAVSDEASPGSNQDETLTGTTYQETITNFPLGTTILTGLFLDVTLSGPEGPPEQSERALLDRIGAAARQSGGTPQLSVSPSDPPPLTSQDAFTLLVSPGQQSLFAIQPEQQNLQAELNQYQAMTSSSPAGVAADPAVASLVQNIMRDANIAAGLTFLAASDNESKVIANEAMVEEYTARPRLTLLTNRIEPSADGTSVAVVSAIDLRRDVVQAIAFPGQATAAVTTFNILHGLLDTRLESEILAPTPVPAGQTGVVFQNSAADIFDAATAQGIPIAAISSDNLSALDTLSISDEAKTRITTAVDQGQLVFVPSQSVSINGNSTVAWYEVNPTTGATIGVTEDGGHQGFVEYAVAIVATYLVVKLAAVALSTLLPVEAAHIAAWFLRLKYESWDLASQRFSGTFPYLQNWNDTPTIIKAKQQLKNDINDSIEDFTFWSAGIRRALNPNSPLTAVNIFAETLRNDLKDIQPNPVKGKNDPPIGSMLIDPTISSFDATGNDITGLPDAGTIAVPAGLPPGAVSGTVSMPNASVSGAVTASWSGQGTSSFMVSSLTAATAVVTGPGGAVIGTGAVSLMAAAPLSAAVAGNVAYGIAGDGQLAFYTPAASGLSASGNWSDYTATLTGHAAVTLSTGGLTLNGQALPAGLYTISTASATLAGAGPSTSPDFSGSASITASAATVVLGPGAGSFSVGGKPLDPSSGVTLTSYAGSIMVSPATGAVSATLNGSAGQVLTIPALAPTATADQNTGVTFTVGVLSSLADNYQVIVSPPPGWTISIDNDTVTAIPAPGLGAGTYAIVITAQSTTDPDLMAQSVVNVKVAPSAPGVSLSVVADPTFSPAVNGVLIPTGFRAEIQNLGPAADTFNVTASSLPNGFSLLTSGTSVTIPAGQTGVLGLYLQPTGAVPAPGTVISFNVTATSASNPAVTQTVTETLTMPAIDAVTVTGNPLSVATTPGTPVSDTLTMTNVGNVAESNVVLTSTLPSGLTLTGLSPVSLQPGQSTTETVNFTPNASTPLNSAFLATITATFGPASAPVTQTLQVPVAVVVPGADAITAAANAAAQLGDGSLAARLDDLSTALTNLVQNPANPVAMSQTLASIDAVSGLLGADPYLVPLTATFATDRAAIAVSTTPAALLTAANSLGTALGTLGTTLTDESAHGLTIALDQNSEVAQPQVPAVFQVIVGNTGSASTTYDLSVSGLPTGVTAALSQPTVTLAPGQTSGSNNVPTITVSLTSTSATDLSPFSFQVTATAEGAPAITRSVTGSLTARTALVQVTSVTPNPTFTNPGGQVDVSAQVLNAVNKQQQARASYTVTDSKGTTLFTSTPVPVTLDVLTTLTKVDLGTLDTTGFAIGDDTITVTVTDAAGHPIAGGTGTGSLLIGTPVTATLSTTPSTLPAGNGTVTTTLQLNSQASSTASALTLAGQAAVAGAGGVAVDGTLAYVATSSAIDVVDVSDPTHPAVLSTFGSGDFPSGAAVQMQVYNNELVVLAQQFASVSYLLVYSLATPSSPTLLGKTPLTLSTGNDMGITLASISNNHVYTTSEAYRYFLGSGEIFGQFGESIDIDISNPASPTVVNVIYNGPPSPSTVYPDGGTGYPDGTTNFWQSAAVNPQTLLIGTTTATMATTSGPTVNGLVMVVNTTDPANPSVVEKLMVPGMAVVTGIVVQGNQAFIVGSSQYWGSGISGLQGNVVVATLDLTNPQSPTIVSTQTLAVASVGIGFLESLGNGQYITSYNANTHGQSNAPALLLLDASDAQNVVASVVDVPAVVNWDAVGASGGLFFTSDGSNLLIYHVGQASSIPVTAQVTVPLNSVVPGSFNTAPNKITTGATTETLEWDLGFSAGNAAATFTWQSNVTGIQPGQLVTVAQGGTVTFTSQGSPGTIALPAQTVAGQQIIGISPTTQTVAPGAAASYTVNLANPTNSPVTYTLSVQGVPSRWLTINPSVTVAANGSATVPLTLASDPFAATSDYGFSVTAAGNNGASGSVQADLVLQGQPAPTDTDSHGIVVTLVPGQATAGQGTSTQYVVQLTNTGSADDTFSLQALGLPAAVTAVFGTGAPGAIDVPPGASNVRDVPLTLTVAQGTPVGPVPFSVTATSTTDASTSGSAPGTLTVVNQGVRVTLNPGSGAPGSNFQATVTNTGSVADTFDLTLGGAGALVSSLGSSQVSLSPGASMSVPVKTNPANYAVAGPLNLMVAATSHTNAAIKGSASAALNVPTSQGVTAAFAPASQKVTQPSTVAFQLNVENTGTAEDAYEAVIVATSGPVTASLLGLDGLPTQTIPIFRLPARSGGILELDAQVLNALQQGQITVMVKSLSNGSIAATATATVNAKSVTLTKTATTLSVIPPHAVVVGHSVTLTATVRNVASGSKPTGSVTFMDGTTVLGSVALGAGDTASLTVRTAQVSALAARQQALGVGTHHIVAIYHGDATHASSRSAAATFVVQPNATTGDGPRITSLLRFGYHMQPTVLVLQFNRALDPTTVENLKNYTIVNLGGPGRDGNRVGQVIKVGSAVYNPSTLTVALYPVARLDIHNRYSITVDGAQPGGVADTSGRRLDGVGNGTPGSNFVGQITRQTLAGPASATGAVLNLPAATPAVPASVVDLLASLNKLTASTPSTTSMASSGTKSASVRAVRTTRT